MMDNPLARYAHNHPRGRIAILMACIVCGFICVYFLIKNIREIILTDLKRKVHADQTKELKDEYAVDDDDELSFESLETPANVGDVCI